MERKAYKELKEWKNSISRKPLLIQGARQVGKTWLVNQFGKNEYKNYIRINFERDDSLKSIFEKKIDPHYIIETLGLYIGQKITSESTLLFFDEIQVIPRAITALKYFHEEAPEYHIIAAGSLLGVSVTGSISFPVGKVNFLNLFPMDFEEYLLAVKENAICEGLSNYNASTGFADPVHKELVNHLRKYMFVGGMPEVVQSWIKVKDVKEIRKIQNEILQAYQNDFSKYSSPSQAIKTAELWESIPTQLAKENKKFKYSDVKKKTRAITWEPTIEWLKKAGLIYISYNITKPEIPLKGYCDRSKFKLYLLDVGLLGAMLNISSDIIINPVEIFSKYNGAIIENLVAQHLSANNEGELHYWTSASDAEIDFILTINDNIIPIEVKYGTSKNLKSLKSYTNKYLPKNHIRYSPRNLHNSGEFYNIPLYVNLKKFLNSII